MRKKVTLAIIVVGIMLVSALVVFSYQERRGNRLQVWDKEKLVTVEGKITDAERPVITMESDGKEYMLHAGPYWFWKKNEFTLEEGQSVKITGIVEDIDGKLSIYPQKIETEGKPALILSDEDGVPAWRGQGGHGHCRGYAEHGRGMHGKHMMGRGFRHGRGW